MEDNKHSCRGGQKEEKSCHAGNNNAEKHANGEAHSCCGGGNEPSTASCCVQTNADACRCGGKKFLSAGKVLIISLVAIIISFVLGQSHIESVWVRIFDPAWIAVVLCGFPIASSAWKSLRYDGKINSPMLITIAMAATISLEFAFLMTNAHGEGHGHSYIFAAGEIAFLMALGEFLEERTIAKSRAGIERLVNLAPKNAVRKNPDGTLEDISAKDIKVGDILLVRPNTAIPTDGRIVSGATSVNQSNMTGESIPVDKGAGDDVLGGTMNESGAIEIEALKPESQSALAKLIELTAEAEGKRAPIARIANRWASYIVPAAITLSVLIFFFAKFALDKSFSESLVRGVTILVVFCPCAFVLATPTAIAAGLGNLSGRGILVKSGAALEELAKINAVLFDKTGTLTTGEITVHSAVSEAADEAELIRLAASAESFSEHPIAKAVVAYAKRNGIKWATPGNVQSIVGVGVECDIDGAKVKVAKSDVFNSAIAQSEKFSEFLKNGDSKTVVGVESDGRLVGLISLSDKFRPDAKSALSTLEKRGYYTAMLTGDNAGAAESVAAELGISRVFHSLMPQNKLEKIEEIKREGKTVCMVGDGVNDAPALAAADCSIAMAALGNDVAIETADVAMMNDDLRNIPAILAFGKRIIFTIKSNMLLSLAISFAAILLSAYGFLDPVTGALVHNVSSVLVVTNSARLLKASKDFRNT